MTEQGANDKPSAMRVDVLANEVRTLLRELVPSSVVIGHGDIVDAEGRRLKQTPIVVAALTHSFALDGSARGVFYIEGVRAAGEVRSVLNRDDWDEAIKNASMFETLRAHRRRTTRSRKGRVAEAPAWFLFASRSTIPLSEIGARLVDAPIDGVFVLDQGCVSGAPDGQGLLVFPLEDEARLLHELAHWLYPDAPREYVTRALRPTPEPEQELDLDVSLAGASR